MLGADRSGSVHNTLRFTITTATTTESASAPHTFIKNLAILYTFTSYLENVTCGSSHLFSGLLRGWSSLVEHHPASASATRSVRSLTAAPRNEHNSSPHTAVLWSGMIRRHPAQRSPISGQKRRTQPLRFVPDGRGARSNQTLVSFSCPTQNKHALLSMHIFPKLIL